MESQFDLRANRENALACVEKSLELMRTLYPCDEQNEWVSVPPIEAQQAIHELQNAKTFLARS